MTSSAPSKWQEVDGALERRWAFAGFREAITFVNTVAKIAEAHDHHPDIEIHYNRVKLRLMTHSKNTITGKDHALAHAIDVI